MNDPRHNLHPNELIGDGDSAYMRHLTGECAGPDTCDHCTEDYPRATKFVPMRNQRPPEQQPVKLASRLPSWHRAWLATLPAPFATP